MPGTVKSLLTDDQMNCLSPWCNRNGWLGVKIQLPTYQPTVIIWGEFTLTMYAWPELAQAYGIFTIVPQNQWHYSCMIGRWSHSCMIGRWSNSCMIARWSQSWSKYRSQWMTSFITQWIRCLYWQYPDSRMDGPKVEEYKSNQSTLPPLIILDPGYI